MSRPQTGTIYTLTDPRDRKIRYIGQTTQPIQTRLSGHLSHPTNRAMRMWIASLERDGHIPQVEAVATVPRSQLLAEEERQIRKHLRAGHRLFNAPYYQKHLGDLDKQPSTHPKPRREQNRLAWAMYAGLEQARREGKVSLPAVLAVLIVTALLCGSLLLLRATLNGLRHALRAMLNNRLGTALIGFPLLGWVLWDAGFDKVVRDLVLPHLPVAAGVAFWCAYLAPPLWNLAMQAVETIPLLAVLAAMGAYFDVNDTVRRL